MFRSGDRDGLAPRAMVLPAVVRRGTRADALLRMKELAALPHAARSVIAPVVGHCTKQIVFGSAVHIGADAILLAHFVPIEASAAIGALGVGRAFDSRMGISAGLVLASSAESADTLCVSWSSKYARRILTIRGLLGRRWLIGLIEIKRDTLPSSGGSSRTG